MRPRPRPNPCTCPRSVISGVVRLMLQVGVCPVCMAPACRSYLCELALKPQPQSWLPTSNCHHAGPQVDGGLTPMYLGSGGVGGLVSMVLQDAGVASGVGLRAAYAEVRS